MPQRLSDILRQPTLGRLALVGLAKNSGKTTTLNALAALARSAGRSLALLSIGVDGEPEDLLLGTIKPRIHVSPDDWIVSAQAALERSSAGLELVASLGLSTPLGELLVARARTTGHVMLAGLRHRGDLQHALDTLSQLQAADLVLIDGAYGRKFAAHGQLSDGIILATGAVLAPTVDRIVARTLDAVSRLQLSAPQLPWQQQLLAEALHQDRCLLGGPTIAPRPLPHASALVGLPRAAHLFDQHVTAVAVPGLVSDAVLETLLAAMSAHAPRTLLVSDGTAIQASPRIWRRWRTAQDTACHVAHRASLLAVSVNPTSPTGHRVDGQALVARLREALGDGGPVVFDPMA